MNNTKQNYRIALVIFLAVYAITFYVALNIMLK